ncbi:MAG: hypothetical protein PHC75_02330 [Burkholderiales bacterium]|nr:hypothetical protein [Burkholderiales bacterium]
MKKITIISLTAAAVALLACNSGGSTAGNNEAYTVTGKTSSVGPIVGTLLTKCSLDDRTVSCDVESGATGIANLTIGANVSPNAYFVKPTDVKEGLSIEYKGLGETPTNSIVGNINIKCTQADMKGASNAEHIIKLDGDAGKWNYITVKCNNKAAK